MTTPRVLPTAPHDMGVPNSLVARRYARRLGIPVLPNVFLMLARHRRLFRRYLSFAYRLMPDGTLPRLDTELLILRTAVNADCYYEWAQHSAIGMRAGLTAAEVARVRDGWEAAEWSPRQALLLKAADELHRDQFLSDATWSELRASFDESRIIELCMLVGNYLMLAMILKSFEVPLENGQSMGRVEDPTESKL